MSIRNNLTLALFSGLLLSASWPTYGFSVLIFFAFVPLFWLEKQTRKEANWKLFLCSYLSFVIWNGLTTWWLWNASAFGMLFAVLVNALLMSILFLSYRWVSRKWPQKVAFIYFVCSWMSFEKLHLHWDFSWPWLNLGHVFSESTAWIQWYEYTGVFGGSLWILIINILLYKVLLTRQPQQRSRNFSLALLAVALPIAISLGIYPRNENHAQISVAIVQPNIDPYKEKYNKSNLDLLVDLKAQFENQEPFPSIILLPETYFAEGFGESLTQFSKSLLSMAINDWLKPHPETQIISGIQFYKTYNSKHYKTDTSNKISDSLWVDFFNSSFVYPHVKGAQIYHKSKLVVGVENLPYRSVIEPVLGNIMLDLGGTVYSRATQKNRSVFQTIEGEKIAPIICYESVYGSFVADYVKEGATLLAIQTNDGWWGETQGHKQHLSYAKLRAIETRKYVLRSANTGISALINPQGQIETQLPYNQKGVLRVDVPVIEGETFYVKNGDFLARIALFVWGLIFLFTTAKKK